VKDIGQVAKRWPGDGGWESYRRWPSAVRRLAKAGGVLAVVGLLTALAVACGGGGESEGSPTPSPTGEDAALAPCNALEALKSYRYSLDLMLESPDLAETPGEVRPTPTITLEPRFDTAVRFDYAIDAAFEAPDRTEAVITAGSGDSFTMIVIGDEAWAELAGQWKAQQNEIPYRPPDICEAVLFDLDLSQVEPQEEKVNDVESLHYSLSQASAPQAMAKIFGASSDMAVLIQALDVELWLAEKDGWPTRLDIAGSGFYSDGRELRVHISIDISDANSDDIRVEPPT
jgi:hypothetical protein